MLTIGDKQYRNLQEQVQKNKDDIATLVNSGNIAELGIKVVNAENPLTDASELPTAATYGGDYGDGYIVGSATPYTLYVYSRTTEPGVKGFWFNFGPLNAPSIVPGPIGPQGIQGNPGVRGSLWYSQSGAPTNTVGVNANDQALDGTSGDVYQYVGSSWQLVGNIRGPQGLQGVQGATGPSGPQGQAGPQGPQGPQGEFIQIAGTLSSTNLLPMIDTVPRSTAYLIPDATGSEHIWLIIGDGTTENPYTWHDAGAFGGGSSVKIDGVPQNEVELGYVPKISVNYQVGEDTTVTSNGSEVTFSNLQTTGYNVNNEQIEGTAEVELPIASSDEIEAKVVDNTLQFGLTPAVQESIQEMIDNSAPQEVQITAPTTSTTGQLTAAQLATLQANKGAYLLFNNEIFRLEDTQHTEGYLVYSHLGFENISTVYMVKCITVTVSTRGWVLTEKMIPSPPAVTPVKLYIHSITITFDDSQWIFSEGGSLHMVLIIDNPTPCTNFSLLLPMLYYYSFTAPEHSMPINFTILSAPSTPTNFECLWVTGSMPNHILNLRGKQISTSSSITRNKQITQVDLLDHATVTDEVTVLQ